MPLLASQVLDEAGARGWIWGVVAGLVLGGVLVAHSGLQIARAFPEDVRANAAAAVKRRPRLAAVGAGVAVWTLVYMLYSLAFPSGAAILGAGPTRTAALETTGDAASAAAVNDNRELLPPSIGGTLDVAPAQLIPTFDAEPAPAAEPTPSPSPTASPPPPSEPPPPTSPPPTEPCPLDPLGLPPEVGDPACQNVS